MLGLIALLVAVLVIVMMVASGGKHGPGRHTSGGISGSEQDAGDARRPVASFTNHIASKGAYP